MKTIKYRAGVKYVLAEHYRQNIAPIVPLRRIRTDFVTLDLLGNLTLRRGFAWNGPDVIPDTPDVMRASAVHDALYGLMRAGHLDPAVFRNAADKLMRQMCVEDKTVHAYAQTIYEGLCLGGEKNTRPEAEPPVLIAPRPEEIPGDIPPP